MTDRPTTNDPRIRAALPMLRRACQRLSMRVPFDAHTELTNNDVYGAIDALTQPDNAVRIDPRELQETIDGMRETIDQTEAAVRAGAAEHEAMLAAVYRLTAEYNDSGLQIVDGRVSVSYRLLVACALLLPAGYEPQDGGR